MKDGMSGDWNGEGGIHCGIFVVVRSGLASL